MMMERNMLTKRIYCEDWHSGEAFYKLEGESNYLEMHFEC